MSLSQEKELMARAKREPEVFGQVFDRHFDAIFRYLLHRTADVALAEDLTAQTFFQALKKVGKFRWSGVSVSAWLFRIAINEANGFLRKQKTRLTARLNANAQEPANPGRAPDQELVAAEEAVAREKEFLQLHEAIRELNQAEQNLIVLRFFENKPYSEIAPILKKKESSLRMTNLRALEKLKGILQRRGINHEIAGRTGKGLAEAGRIEFPPGLEIPSP